MVQIRRQSDQGEGSPAIGRRVGGEIETVGAGFVFGFWGQDFMPGFFYNTLPLPVVAGVVAALLYGIAATLWRPRQAAGATAGPVPGSATAPGSAS
jgi:hypothetical protein